MLPSSREITFQAPISRIALGDDSSLHVIDNNCTLHKINLDTLHISKSTTLSSSYVPSLFDYYQRPFALGKTRAYISFSKEGNEYIIDTKAKLTKLCSFNHNFGAKVTKARISSNEKLLITGNEKGRTFIINTLDGHLIAELPRSSDSITAVTIKDSVKLAARASFSRGLIVYQYNTLSIKLELRLDCVIEMLSFVDENTLLAISRTGKILKIDIQKGQVVQEVLLDENLWPSFMGLSDSKKFVYVGTRESMLFALHVKSLDILFQAKLPYLGITSFVRTGRFFIFGFKSGEILFLNHREFEEPFTLNIKLKKIKEASLYFHKNIFLMTHRDTRLIYDEWLVQKETIINLLSLGHIDEAKTLAEPFLFHPKCKLEFSQIEELQPDLMALHRYFRSFSFPAAYELAHSKPLLRKSTIYAQMEALWNKNLQKAQILLSRDPIINKEMAKQSLKLFADVEEKKVMIEQMIKNSTIFMLSESAIKEKNFALYFKMVSQNSFLELTPLYKKVLLLGEKLQAQIVALLEEKNYSAALNVSALLYDFVPYRNQAIRLKEVCNALSLLEYQTEHQQLFLAIQTQNRFKLGLNYAPIKLLEEMKIHFQEEQLRAIERKEYAKVYGALVPYMSIDICRENVSFVMRKLYMAQFIDAYESCATGIDWNKSCDLYMHLFGPDALLKSFIHGNELGVTLLDEDVSEQEAPSQDLQKYPHDILVLKTQ